MNSNQSLQTSKLVGAVVITAVLMIGFYFLILNNKTNPGVAMATSTTTAVTATAGPSSASTPSPSPAAGTPAASTTTPTNTAVASVASPFKDGTYTASAEYYVPDDVNSIKVSITVKDGTIVALQTQHSYGQGESIGYINNFTQAVKGAVVGKKLDSAKVSRLNGASDTSIGFNQALSNIITQAKT